MRTETKASGERNGVVEAGPGFASGLRDFSRHLNASTFSAGLIAAIFGNTGPALIIIDAARNGRLTQTETISWLFSIYFFGGLISLLLALYYKQPINGAWSIPGAVLLGTSLANFSFPEAVGAYFVAGALVFVLGISGLIGRVMHRVPIPIVMGMIAGALIRFGTGIVNSVQKNVLISGTAVLVYLIVVRISRKLPAALIALLAGALVGIGSIHVQDFSLSFVGPQLFKPEFTLPAFLGIALPLAILVIGAENAQAYGVLIAEGYRPPINAMTVVSGIGGMVTSFFGGHNANIAGPMTAICSSEEAGEDKSGRYVATVVNGILFGAFGLFASVAVSLVQALPGELVALVAGLAMIGVLLSAFREAFTPKRFSIGAFAALVVAMSNISVAKISAPFWALVVGVLVSYLVEPGDFRSQQAKASA
ncbi:MAG: benzoate/H(+) symporter BenE family transporter [Acidobacteria bacterium]|nr:benzoate/H(+) symporter BenE family transporter [Acidobacteriota bacterium]